MSKSLVMSVLISILIANCATAGNSVIANPNMAVSQIVVNPVKVNLKQKYDNPNFYTQDEMSSYLTQCLAKQLQFKGKQVVSSVNAPQLNVTADYKRVYSGEAFGMRKSVSRPTLGYKLQVIQNSKLLQQKSVDNLTYKNGLLGNMKTAMTADLGNTQKSAENEYLDTFCKTIVNEVK